MSKNPDKLQGANDNEKLRDLFSRTYKEQAIWILNGFWDSHNMEKEAENFWNWVNKHQELDTAKGKEGASLDEFNAHRFLESIKETLTVLAMREKLNKMGIEKVKNVPLAHFLIWKYNLKASEVAKASQGSNREELAEAQRLLTEVLSAFREVESTANEAKKRESEAIRLEGLAREAERPFKEAQEELNAALAELKRQEDSYKNKTDDLKRKSEEGGAVSRNKAKAELEIHLKEDPLPLRKAKITTEAAERKADKLRAPFKAARESAESARAQAESARREAEEALAEAQRRLEEAERYLEEVKSKPGQPSGALWWIERELHESKKYLPGRKAK